MIEVDGARRVRAGDPDRDIHLAAFVLAHQGYLAPHDQVAVAARSAPPDPDALDHRIQTGIFINVHPVLPELGTSDNLSIPVRTGWTI